VCFPQEIPHTFRLTTDTDSKYQTPLVPKYGLHPHPVTILKRITVHTDTHKPKLHLTGSKTKASLPHTQTHTLPDLSISKSLHSPLHPLLYKSCPANLESEASDTNNFAVTAFAEKSVFSWL
jgi:hypothetical protein